MAADALVKDGLGDVGVEGRQRIVEQVHISIGVHGAGNGKLRVFVREGVGECLRTIASKTLEEHEETKHASANSAGVCVRVKRYYCRAHK